MDREAAVIRSEMSQTRAELDRKLTALEERAHELSPRRLSERYLPSYPLDRAIGAVLTLIGLQMAVRQYRMQRHRRKRVRNALAAYGTW